MNQGTTTRRCDGFSLIEGIGALILFVIMMGALTYGSATLFHFQAHPNVSYNGSTFFSAPDLGEFNQAITLHSAFAQAEDQADSILVFGGSRSHPTLDPNGPSSALSESFNDTELTAAIGSDPFQGYSSWDQLQLNAAQLDPYLTTNPDPADFTILTVQGQSRITSVTQQRRYTASINGQDVALYEVTFQPYDWSTGTAVAGTLLYYRVYYAANEDVWGDRPGAVHYWYRSDSAWDRDQEGPTRVVFADPYVLAGQDPQGQITCVSRFVYFLPQVR